jgi:hypothetical protein
MMMATTVNSTIISGINHHFFSYLANFRITLNKAHMVDWQG